MATPLGFVTWGSDDQFYPPGEVAKLTDGVSISILYSAKKLVESSGKNISEFEFKMQLQKDGQTVAEHVFKTEDANNFWLIADPAESDENGSFTAIFASEFANSVAGEQNYTLKLFVNDELSHEGNIIYNSDGQGTIYKELIPKFKNISATRDEANKKHQQEYAQKEADEAKAKDEAREFKITITNVDSGHTKYILETHQVTLSEKIHEITPMQTLTLSLFRGSSFELKYYDQDWKKEDALFIAIIDESCHNKEYIVK